MSILLIKLIIIHIYFLKLKSKNLQKSTKAGTYTSQSRFVMFILKKTNVRGGGEKGWEID